MRRGGTVTFARDEWLPEATSEETVGEEDPEAEPNWALLSQIAETTGGGVNAPLAEILKRAPADRQVASPLVQLLAMTALALVAGDILLRLLARGPRL
jgi:hypothetical protein